MKFKADLNLSAWLQNVEVEASSAEEAEDVLAKMSISDLLDTGYVKDSEYTDIDLEIVEATFEVQAKDIKFDEYELELNPGLTSIRDLKVTVTSSEEELEQAISDAIFDAVDAIPDSFDYDILKKY